MQIYSCKTQMDLPGVRLNNHLARLIPFTSIPIRQFRSFSFFDCLNGQPFNLCVALNKIVHHRFPFSDHLISRLGTMFALVARGRKIKMDIQIQINRYSYPLKHVYGYPYSHPF